MNPLGIEKLPNYHEHISLNESGLRILRIEILLLLCCNDWIHLLIWPNLNRLNFVTKGLERKIRPSEISFLVCEFHVLSSLPPFRKIICIIINILKLSVISVSFEILKIQKWRTKETKTKAKVTVNPPVFHLLRV